MTGRGQQKGSSRSARRQWGASRWGPMLLAGGVVAASVGVTADPPTATYSAAVRLVGTTIGVGASYDAFALSIPVFFYGTVIPEGDSYRVVPYPAQISVSIPIISDLPGLSVLPYWTQSLKRSEAIGAGYLLQAIASTPTGDKVTIIGVSQGTQVAEIARTEMAKLSNYVANARNYEFILIGDPYQPNGGLLSRLAGWSDLPVLGDMFPFGRPGPSDSPFKTTFYQNQYDGVADFPAYFNVLSIANSLAGMAFGHAFPGYVLEHPDAPNTVTTQVGNTTYVTLPQYLPLLAPLRIPASVIGAERFVDALDPVLRVFVEMGYDRTADPSRVKEFSWTMPEEKVTEALNALPGAFKQSLAILGGEKYIPTLPQPVVSDDAPDTPLPEHPAEPVGTSPFEQGLRQAMDDVAARLSNATRPLAKIFQAIGGRTPAAKVTDTDVADAAKAKEAPAAGETNERPAAPVYRLNRSARTQLNQPRSGPVQRLKTLREQKQSGRDGVRSLVRSAKESTKSGHAQRHDPPKRKSKRAG
ncbi:PE-PPE domain-containing protein [Mycobacterium sp. 20091114027_K0903767]|nr:PE-PPE domain-containing protein [Mycolicibacterium porcinum]MBX8685899.1 PE-PPE domain-containing protein [Mycobacterium sp. 20091114027_K0903767]ODR26262.1 PE-PPE domain-containing protein [Mycolicibacterium porcinum]